jgi:hypothetical protein
MQEITSTTENAAIDTSQEWKEKSPEQTIEVLSKNLVHFSTILRNSSSRLDRLVKLTGRMSAASWDEAKHSRMDRRIQNSRTLAQQADEICSNIKIQLTKLGVEIPQ